MVDGSLGFIQVESSPEYVLHVKLGYENDQLKIQILFSAPCRTSSSKTKHTSLESVNATFDPIVSVFSHF